MDLSIRTMTVISHTPHFIFSITYRQSAPVPLPGSIFDTNAFLCSWGTISTTDLLAHIYQTLISCNPPSEVIHNFSTELPVAIYCMTPTWPTSIQKVSFLILALNQHVAPMPCSHWSLPLLPKVQPIYKPRNDIRCPLGQLVQQILSPHCYSIIILQYINRTLLSLSEQLYHSLESSICLPESGNLNPKINSFLYITPQNVMTWS